MLWFGLNLQHICFSCFQTLQDAQEKQQILIKQKLELENKLQNTEKELKKVRYGEASWISNVLNCLSYVLLS